MPNLTTQQDRKHLNLELKRPRRVLLKLSGEVLMGDKAFGIDSKACLKLAESIKAFKAEGMELGIVIGGGNIFRGISLNDMGMERSPADQIGMLATMMNGISLQQSLDKVGCSARVLTALESPGVAESYTWWSAKKYLADGEVIIFVGGTGNPYFTTDTAAAMRASEIHADIFLKATKVDGIYNKDPLKHVDAVKYQTLSYSKMLAENLGVMDATSVALCRSNQIPILVFNMDLLNSGTSLNSLIKESLGSIVSGE